ncbi:NAD(P)/FAD-dependent oxidoreductase [Pseudooceanicola nanhaiensis]|uniref:NAD(P)/FAD-dependent oxidoreductase n=1 Tax=Pseudooceanicola nanhaiensis TaxID=375761 RepID=UPI001CD41A00|nr:FAD-dependent oxidoreductase [Pseudooceanicola nanhaiensis]MCA0920825.1 FAD-binding oxidoreductase [Pseudooceanicola nanhaiensis]
MKCIVIGGGMLGAATTYSLALAGADVTVIDAAHPGKATLAGAGIICPWATVRDQPEFYRLYAAGGAYYRRLIAELEAAGCSDTGYRQVGALIMGRDADALESARARLALRLPDAPEAGVLSEKTAAEAQALFPALGPDRPALHLSGGGRVEAATLCAALLARAADLGARRVTGTAGLTLDDAGRPQVTLEGATLPADRVIVAGGAWANEMLAPLGLAQQVRPQKGQIVHLRLAQDVTDWPVILPGTGYYMLTFADRRVVIGATREDDAGFDQRVTAAGNLEVLQAGLEFAPGLAGAEHIRTKVGTRPFTDGMVPMLGAVPGSQGLLIGNGLGAWGLTAGPLGGRLLAQAALGMATDLDLAAYAPTGL